MISSFVRLGLSVWLTHVFPWRWWIGRGLGWSFVGDHIPGLVMLLEVVLRSPRSAKKKQSVEISGWGGGGGGGI